MGVPKFFAWLMRNYKNIMFDKDKKEIDWFLIDTNCLIHPICFEILKQEQIKENINFNSLENKMMNAVIDYIDKLINYVNPKEGIYIAIDGPVCYAKIKQQRQRRYRSVHDKTFFDKIKKKHNIPINFYWNNSAISPGTKFMDSLHYKLLNYINNLNRKIIYSSSNVPGEGEHKLLDFIKENNKNNIQYSYMTYGLDADLIFLMLVTKLDTIYLLREANEINNKESKDILKIVNMKTLKECIIESFVKSFEYKIDLDRNRITNDFIFLCYLLGNDFLPHILALDISKNGIEYIISKYVKTFQELPIYLLSIDTNTINQNFLSLFLKNLSVDEDSILIEKFNIKYKPKYIGTNEYEREMFKIDNLLFKINDPIGIGVNSNYRNLYYKHYFDVDDDELEDFVKNMVKHYLIGIRWVAYYYFDKIVDWEWYYPYDYPPFLSDIYKYLIDLNDIKFKKTNPITPFELLLVVLPPQSNYLLPEKFKKIPTNPKSSLYHLYPNDFEIDFLYKNKYWEGIPILPSLEIKSVRYIYSKYKDELTDEELKRNRLDNNFYK